MHADHIKERAVRFRIEENASIDEIATWLSVSRTTVYAWLRDHPIDRDARPVPTEARRRAGEAVAARAREKREVAFAQGVAEWPRLSRDPSFRDFVVLYIAEGSKRNRNSVEMCNSDVAALRPARLWLPRLSVRPLRYSVQVHADQDTAELREHWAVQLGIAPDVIAFHPKTNSGRLAGRRWRSAHGVMAIRTGDTLFRARLEAWIQIVRAGWLDLPHGV